MHKCRGNVANNQGYEHEGKRAVQFKQLFR
jgi:hypothetical protein